MTQQRGKSGQVELPKYVRRITKPPKGGNTTGGGTTGRVYTLFIKHRNTPQAWPAIQLPDPLTRDFAVRYDICCALAILTAMFTALEKENVK